MPIDLSRRRSRPSPTGFPIALLHVVVTHGDPVRRPRPSTSLLTPHREISLIREGNAAAAVSLGGVLVGLAIPLAVSLQASTSLIETGALGRGHRGGAAAGLPSGRPAAARPAAAHPGGRDVAAAALLVGAKLATAMVLAAAVSRPEPTSCHAFPEAARLADLRRGGGGAADRRARPAGARRRARRRRRRSPGEEGAAAGPGLARSTPLWWWKSPTAVRARRRHRLLGRPTPASG